MTHPDITRFFMTIPRPRGWWAQAGAIGEGSQVFVLDMGRPVQIVDRWRATRSSLKQSHTLAEIPIAFSGLRPGERSCSELGAGDADATLPTRFEAAAAHRAAGCVGQLVDERRLQAGLGRRHSSAPDDRCASAWRGWCPSTAQRGSGLAG